ncbi:hypothetical protein ACFQV2_13525 [Actinokineospora soli]|uniref:Uncharacterized protein n=1 Tax=Actinokineospora soli TaxID=1048753 RepID=A0ABW2TLZ2_9PSEU
MRCPVSLGGADPANASIHAQSKSTSRSVPSGSTMTLPCCRSPWAKPADWVRRSRSRHAAARAVSDPVSPASTRSSTCWLSVFPVTHCIRTTGHVRPLTAIASSTHWLVATSPVSPRSAKCALSAV